MKVHPTIALRRAIRAVAECRAKLAAARTVTREIKAELHAAVNDLDAAYTASPHRPRSVWLDAELVQAIAIEAWLDPRTVVAWLDKTRDASPETSAVICRAIRRCRDYEASRLDTDARERLDAAIESGALEGCL